MGFSTGRNGRVIYNGKKVAKVQDFSLDPSVELYPTDDLESFAKTYTPGMKEAKGSFTVIYYRLEPNDNRAALVEFVELLQKLVKVGPITEADRIRIQLQTGPLATDLVELDVYITQAQIGVTRGELTSVPLQFTMNGDFIDVIS